MLGICSDCKEPCEVIIVDSGIGAYEYWGARGIDVQLEAVSNCCDAPAYIDSSEDFVTVSMIKDEEEYNNCYNL